MRLDSSALGSSTETVLRCIILLLLSDVYHPLSSAKTRLSDLDLGAAIERFFQRVGVGLSVSTSIEPSNPSIGPKRNPSDR